MNHMRVDKRMKWCQACGTKWKINTTGIDEQDLFVVEITAAFELERCEEVNDTMLSRLDQATWEWGAGFTFQ